MTRPKMDKEIRESLLAEIEQRISFLEEKDNNESCVGWWSGKASGVNDVYRFISTGEWET